MNSSNFVIAIAASLMISSGAPSLAHNENGGGSGTVESGTVEAGTVQPDGVVNAGVAHSGPGKVVSVKTMKEAEKKNKKKEKKNKKIMPDCQKPDDVTASGTPESAIRAYERKTQGSRPNMPSSGTVTALNDPAINGALRPGLKLYMLRYRVWPIAMEIKPPLQTNNIFALDAKNKIVDIISEPAQSQKFFGEHVIVVENDEQARKAMTSWLRIQDELAQDGMFIFHSAPESFVVQVAGPNIVISGRSTIEPKGGDSGEVVGKLTFVNGKLTRADTEKNIQSGMRPICQSTKLLDKDPLVRRMAEQDILIMGRRCKFYLDDQKMKVSPELQEAIDRIWKRIEVENR